jgi:hypothetical protein
MSSQRRLRGNSQPAPSNSAVHANGFAALDAVVTGAVVATITVAVAMLPLSCTGEFDKLQVGAGIATGAMLQLRVTVPVKDPVGAKARLNSAFCPALTVCEPGDPEASPTVKSGAATPAPESAIVCGLPPMAILPVRLPVAEGVNVTEI